MGVSVDVEFRDSLLAVPTSKTIEDEITHVTCKYLQFHRAPVGIRGAFGSNAGSFHVKMPRPNSAVPKVDILAFSPF